MTYRRAWIALLIFTAVIINYMDRIALSVAAKPIAAEFGFSPIQMGYLFSGFLWTYVICLIPIGLIVEKVGAKRMVGGGIAIWSAATAVTAMTTGFASILAARLIMGASEATTFPACGRIIRDWFPERERGLVTTLFNGGSSAGPAIGAMVAAALVSSFGWRISFVVLGALGFVWLAAWLYWYGQPENVIWLPETERQKIISKRNGELATNVGDDPAPSSLRYLLSQTSIWGLVITQACLVYTAYLFLTWLPTFLQSTRELSTMNTGYLTAVPYLITMLFGLTIAWTSDRALSSAAIQAGKRRNFIAAMAVLSLLILLAPVVGSLWQLLLILTLVLTGSTTGAGLNFTLASDLLRNPRDVSRVIAITAFGGNLFGLIAPIITGYVVSGTGGYTWAFRIAAVLLLCGAFATLLMTRKPIESEYGPRKP
ncbi:ACS family glucarate transporter-like MFS transporter [Phyllobacterium trifolii]|uniref:ACS family glucarate transporter-like MFS transporter n=1 Tax=Phyllobacterium trifolii TaxID=300193 RepID=A0A839UEM9_9HYPH|nr:MFS transporter [Phyllobacterium trifolii]MBB3149476.1 ACS family glucarate transporter-like MFS transporter [Phyllobacterium trifolii]